MPFLDAHELIAFALEQACEENLMKRWIACYQPEMDFDEFKQNEYDKLADLLREHLDIQKIYEIMTEHENKIL